VKRVRRGSDEEENVEDDDKKRDKYIMTNVMGRERNSHGLHKSI
jgi:hypothetical protein